MAQIVVTVDKYSPYEDLSQAEKQELLVSRLNRMYPRKIATTDINLFGVWTTITGKLDIYESTKYTKGIFSYTIKVNEDSVMDSLVFELSELPLSSMELTDDEIKTLNHVIKDVYQEIKSGDIVFSDYSKSDTIKDYLYGGKHYDRLVDTVYHREFLEYIKDEVGAGSYFSSTVIDDLVQTIASDLDETDLSDYFTIENDNF